MRSSEQFFERRPRYRLLWNANRYFALPTPKAFDVKVHANGQPVISRAVGEELNSKYALDALERGILPMAEGIEIWDRRLANDLKLQEMLEPRRAGQKPVIFGKPRSEIPVEGAFTFLVREALLDPLRECIHARYRGEIGAVKPEVMLFR